MASSSPSHSPAAWATTALMADAAISDAAILEAVVSGGLQAAPKGKANRDALHDFELPSIVRGFIAAHDAPATYTMAMREAGMLPRLYATYEGRRVRITCVSRLGDIGIRYNDEAWGYDRRGLSFYDLTDFDTERFPGAPAERKTTRAWAIADKANRWVRIDWVENTERWAARVARYPVFVEEGQAHDLIRKVDPIGLKGFKRVCLNFHPEAR